MTDPTPDPPTPLPGAIDYDADYDELAFHGYVSRHMPNRAQADRWRKVIRSKARSNKLRIRTFIRHDRDDELRVSAGTLDLPLALSDAALQELRENLDRAFPRAFPPK